MIELKPCYCGFTPRCREHVRDGRMKHGILCDFCGAATSWYITPTIAAAAWNARADDTRHYTDDDYRRLHAQLCDTEARRPELAKENDKLRAMIANSGKPCVYCDLPADKWVECVSGFPGCARADDAMLCPHVGAELTSRDRITALETTNKKLQAALRSARAWTAYLNSDVADTIRIGIDAALKGPST